MTLDDAVDLQNRFMAGFDLVLGSAALSAPESTLRLLGVSGPAAAVWDGYGWNATLPILHTRLSPADSGLRLSLIRATDDQGRMVAVSQSLYGGSGKFSFVLNPAPRAKQIQATLALHRPRFAEFTARPTTSRRCASTTR